MQALSCTSGALARTRAVGAAFSMRNRVLHGGAGPAPLAAITPGLLVSGAARSMGAAGGAVIGAWATAAGAAGLRAMSYFSGSHFDSEHMVDAKNPHLPQDAGAADAAVRIFGTSPVSNPHQRSIRKLLNAPLRGEALASWYPPELRHNVHGYQDPFRLRREAQLARLRRRGKGPPKKGQGKRSKKK